MLTNETINEMVRIVHASNKMCEDHPDCIDCPARVINCEFTDYNKNLVELIRIIDRYDREYTEQMQGKPTETENPKEIEEWVDDLELYRRQMQSWKEEIAQRLDKIEDHAAHQDEFMQTKCVHVDDDPGEEPPKKRTRLDAFLDMFPNARMCSGTHIPMAAPCTLDVKKHPHPCIGKSCTECIRQYWNEEVDG